MLLRLVSLATCMGIALLTGCSHSAKAGKAAVNSSIGHGNKLYALECSSCHGNGGTNALVGPVLRGERLRKSHRAIVDAIENPTPPMPKLYPGTLTGQDVADIAAYVESL